MPAQSQAQRAWAFAVKGERWARAHGYATKGKLPKKKRKTKAKGRRR